MSQTQIDMVRLGYGDSYPGRTGRALDFTVGFDSLEDAYEAIRAIGPYNDFDPDKVIPVLEAITETPGGFPSAKAGLSVGREGSPCIYINKVSITDEAALRAYLAEAALLLHEDARADEVDTVSGGAGCSYGTTIRAWWD